MTYSYWRIEILDGLATISQGDHVLGVTPDIRLAEELVRVHNADVDHLLGDHS